MAHNFKDKMVDRGKNNTLIVDALNLAFRWKHQGRTDFCADFIRTVQSFAQSYNCSNVLITSDWGASSYRRDISPEYKANRKEKYAEQSEEEKEAFEQFFAEYERTLMALAEFYKVFRYQGVEADDIAAYLVKQRTKYGFDDVWLISSDRDWDLLIAEGVSRFSYVNRKEFTIDNWSEHYDVSPEEYISFKCLTGDKGDNVPGVPGIGPVRATALIREYGSAMDIYDALPIDGKYKYIVNLNEFNEGLLTNYELMDLVTYCEEAIGAENVKDIEGMFSED
jgi:5'-3' exonuclease